MEWDVDKAVEELEALRVQHDYAGKKLLNACNGRLFPCDALYLSVLNRSIELFDGFLLLIKNGNYGCGFPLLRIQLDNVLRFNGVLHALDAHETANAIFQGAKLSSLKDKSGKMLRDYYLVEIMSKNNSWVKHVYQLASGYIHLSDQHIFHMLGRSQSTGNGERDFFVGSSDEHVEPKDKVELIKAFGVITEGVFKLLPEWEKLSKDYDPVELENRYAIYP